METLCRDRVAYRQAEAAAILGVPLHTLYRRVRDGRQEHVRISPGTAVIPHVALAAALGVANPEDQQPAALREALTLPVPVAAELLGVAAYSVERGIAKGWIPIVRVGGLAEVPVGWLELLRTGAAMTRHASVSDQAPAAAPSGSTVEEGAAARGSTASDAATPAASTPTRRHLRPASLSADRCAYSVGEAARALRLKPKSLLASCRAGEVHAAELRAGFFVIAHHWLARELKCPDAIYEPCPSLYARAAFRREEVRKLLGVGRDTVARAIEEERIPFEDADGDPIVPVWWLAHLRTGREPSEAILRLWRGDEVAGWREVDGMLVEPRFADAETVTLADVPMRRPQEPEGERRRGAPVSGEEATGVVDLALMRALRLRGEAKSRR